MQPPEGDRFRDLPDPPVSAGYCVACRSKREMTETKWTERSGGLAIEGKCSVCGAKMFVLGVETPDG